MLVEAANFTLTVEDAMASMSEAPRPEVVVSNWWMSTLPATSLAKPLRWLSTVSESSRLPRCTNCRTATERNGWFAAIPDTLPNRQPAARRAHGQPQGLNGGSVEGDLDDPAVAREREVKKREEHEVEFSRIVAFSDGVFSIAITLLVLGISSTGAPRTRSSGMRSVNQHEALLAYAISFAVIARFWLVHHALLQRSRRRSTAG